MDATTPSCLKYHYLFFLSCGTSTEVHFEQIVNFEMLKFIGNRELSNIKELCNQESNELSNLREL